MKTGISNRGLSAIPILEGAKTIEDNSIQNLKFNVMHRKNVEERLRKYVGVHTPKAFCVL